MKAPIRSHFISFSVLISMWFPVSAQLNEQTLKKPIYIQAKEVRIDSLMRIFSKQTGVEFSFNSVKISPAKKLSVHARNQTLEQWLANMKNSLGIQYKIVGNHIVLLDNPGKIVNGKNVTANSNSQNNNLVRLKNPDRVRIITSTELMANDRDYDSIQVQEMNRTRSQLEDTLESNPKAPLPMKTIKVSRLQIVEPPPPEVRSVQETKDNSPKPTSLQFIGGYSKHGSGDMKGMVFGFEISQYFSTRFSVTYILRGTINSSKDEILVTNGGTTTDASIRFTTAGVQIGANAGYSIIRSTQHEFMIKLGAFGRYQSASNGSDGYRLYDPAMTGIPSVLVEYNNVTPQETLSVGGTFQFQYNFTFNNRMYIGLQPGFQTDTNGDAVLMGSLLVGKRF